MGLLDQDDFKSNDVFLARLAATDVLGVSNMFDNNLDLIFWSSDMIRNGEIKHIIKNEFNFYAVNGRLMRYTRKDAESRKPYTVSYKYDRHGNLTAIKNNYNSTDTFTYDKNGKLVSFTYVDAENNICKIKRDKDGKIVSVNNCQYYYYDNGLLRSLTTYDGDMTNGLGVYEGSSEISTIYCNDSNSVNASILSYTNI